MGEFNTKPKSFEDLYQEVQKHTSKYVIRHDLLGAGKPELDLDLVKRKEEPKSEEPNRFSTHSFKRDKPIDYESYYPFGVRKLVSNEPEEVEGDFKFMSMLGTPLIMPVKIDGFQLPNEPLITITGDKKIVRTSINGANSEGRIQHRGSVKELITVNDYQIKIAGRIVSEKRQNAYPRDEVKRLIKIFESRKSLEIQCALTQLFGIEYIAISKVSFPGEAGMHNNQRYEITGYSDEDFETDLLSQV